MAGFEQFFEEFKFAGHDDSSALFWAGWLSIGIVWLGLTSFLFFGSQLSISMVTAVPPPTPLPPMTRSESRALAAAVRRTSKSSSPKPRPLPLISSADDVPPFVLKPPWGHHDGKLVDWKRTAPEGARSALLEFPASQEDNTRARGESDIHASPAAAKMCAPLAGTRPSTPVLAAQADLATGVVYPREGPVEHPQCRDATPVADAGRAHVPTSTEGIARSVVEPLQNDSSHFGGDYNSVLAPVPVPTGEMATPVRFSPVANRPTWAPSSGPQMLPPREINPLFKFREEPTWYFMAAAFQLLSLAAATAAATPPTQDIDMPDAPADASALAPPSPAAAPVPAPAPAPALAPAPIFFSAPAIRPAHRPPRTRLPASMRRAAAAARAPAAPTPAPALASAPAVVRPPVPAPAPAPALVRTSVQVTAPAPAAPAPTRAQAPLPAPAPAAPAPRAPAPAPTPAQAALPAPASARTTTPSVSVEGVYPMANQNWMLPTSEMLAFDIGHWGMTEDELMAWEPEADSLTVPEGSKDPKACEDPITLAVRFGGVSLALKQTVVLLRLQLAHSRPGRRSPVATFDKLKTLVWRASYQYSQILKFDKDRNYLHCADYAKFKDAWDFFFARIISKPEFAAWANEVRPAVDMGQLRGRAQTVWLALRVPKNRPSALSRTLDNLLAMV
ncbi:hypothetical protein BU23DRAFT_112791 [Bimuria novae-zelandiae CBS 107.79]|uniref:Uncharacterized protein n=1 Tax=Bimuria novae-zelandiae CBS 107.79 TaxID=1447943 RepID=A0A6A5VTR9_9PLEO|nr:hypothetical protein BU23DRAFT_112791 [Bimuria novae-zelandiae CBS 107.79]